MTRRYGVIRGRGPDYKKIQAHRASWEMSAGREVPDGLWVLHKCDNPLCVRPDHLFLGTSQDNIDDRQRKMRHAYGERSPKARLTEEMVLEIRRRYQAGETQVEIAPDYGLSQGSVSGIVLRRSWKHI